MGKGRYSGTPIIDGHHYATFSLPSRAMGYVELDLLAGVRTVEHTYQLGDRPDRLAAKFFGDETYWWVIMLVNGISYPFSSGGLIPGRVLRIPLDVRDVLDKLQG